MLQHPPYARATPLARKESQTHGRTSGARATLPRSLRAEGAASCRGGRGQRHPPHEGASRRFSHRRGVRPSKVSPPRPLLSHAFVLPAHASCDPNPPKPNCNLPRWRREAHPARPRWAADAAPAGGVAGAAAAGSRGRTREVRRAVDGARCARGRTDGCGLGCVFVFPPFPHMAGASSTATSDGKATAGGAAAAPPTHRARRRRRRAPPGRRRRVAAAAAALEAEPEPGGPPFLLILFLMCPRTVLPLYPPLRCRRVSSLSSLCGSACAHIFTR